MARDSATVNESAVRHASAGVLDWFRRLFLATVILLLAACQSAPGTTELSNGLHVPRSEGGTRSVGDAALLEGRVIDRDGCLAIQHDEPDSDHVTVPVFDVKDKRPEKSRIGQHLSLGGGWMPPQESFDIPDECAGEESYFLVVRE